MTDVGLVGLELAGIGFLAGLVRGFTGFGSGLVMAPVLLLILEPVTAVPVMLLLDIGVSFYLVRGAARLWRRHLVLPLSAAASAAFPLGALLLVGLQALVVTRTVSLLVLIMAVVIGAGWRLRRPPSRIALVLAGAGSGVLSALGGIGGPPVALLLMSAPGTHRETRADLITHFAILRLTALVTFAMLGLLSLSFVRWLVLITPAFIGGAVLGSRLLTVSTDPTYRLAAAALMIGSAIVGVLG